jgi:DnaJ-class molecular chaperone
MISKDIIDKYLKEDNFYTLLGVEQTATKQEIEKAFRKLSVKWHPDKLKLADDNLLESAKQVFQKMNEAKDALTDERKREIYDKYGKDGLKENGPDMNPEHQQEMMQEFMKKMFGNKVNKKTSVSNITIIEECTLEELYNGKEYNKDVERLSLCKDCNGYGTEDGLEHKCTDCGGSGMQIKVIKQGNVIQQMQQICTLCRGSGSSSKVKHCAKCKGKKLFRENANISIKIPKGSYENIGLEIKNAGNEIPLNERDNNGYSRTSIIIKIKESPHVIYERGFRIPKYKENPEPKDLKMNLKITLAESLVGFSKTINFVNGKEITIFHENLIKQGDVLIVKNYGMPILENNTSNGHLYIVFDIIYPDKISNNTKKILWQVLTNTPYKESNVTIKDTNVHLDKPENIRNENSRNSRVPPGYGRQNNNSGDNDDNDDNNNPFGGQPPECKVQ